MELSITTLFSLIVVFAIGAGILLLTLGKWLDLTAWKYRMDTQRNAMNLLHVIVASSPIMEIDTFNDKPQNEPNKLVLSSDKLSTYIKDPSTHQTPPTEERADWESCCDFLDYDYNLNVIDIISKTSWTMKSLVFKEFSTCYPDRHVGIAEMPVVISYPDGRKNPGIATLNLSRTSLSELSFWLSQAFARASTQPGYGDAFPDAGQLYQVTVRLDQEIEDVVIDQNNHRVCVNVTSKFYCKSFAYLPNIELNVKGWYTPANSCQDVVISSLYGSVNVTYV